MKFVALVSGGKDSFYSILQCQQQGHELVACVHLGRPAPQRNSPNKAALSSQADGEEEEEEEEEESYMYQTAGSEVIQVLVEDCMEVPLVLHQRTGRSLYTGLVYENNGTTTATTGNETDPPQDEVEDLYQALAKAVELFPDVQAVSSGAILSTYQRVRIEHVCARLRLTSLSYLWRAGSQRELLRRMIETNMEAVLVKAAAPPGLRPRIHLGKTIATLEPLFHKLFDQYQFHICGEGGEYETLVLDCPGLFRKRLILAETRIVISNEDDGVGELLVLKCHAEPKTETTAAVAASDIRDTTSGGDGTDKHRSDIVSEKATKPKTIIPPPPPVIAVPSSYMPKVCRVSGGIWHVSEIMSPLVAVRYPSLPPPDAAGTVASTSSQIVASEADLAVKEAAAVLSIFRTVLQRTLHSTPKDVVMVHVYLSEMSHFAKINALYQEFFGIVLPPSRSCVAVGRGALPGGRRFLLDALVLSGSGAALRRQQADNSSSSSSSSSSELGAPSHPLPHPFSYNRKVLHVQSRSHWAPVCVGPYSQAQTLGGGGNGCGTMHVCAGQIGLVPATMVLAKGGWKNQLEQTWTNVAAVLDALADGGGRGGSLNDLLSGIVYVSDKVFSKPMAEEEGMTLDDHDHNDTVSKVQAICHDCIATNSGIVPGVVDGTATPSEEPLLHGGYEDEGTWRAMMSSEAEQERLELEQLKEQAAEAESSGPCPLLLVSIPEMPVGALVEVEIVAATGSAADCLNLYNTAVISSSLSSSNDNSNGNNENSNNYNVERNPISTSSLVGWDTGHEPDVFCGHGSNDNASATTNSGGSNGDDIQISAVARVMGHGCATFGIVTCGLKNDKNTDNSSKETQSTAIDLPLDVIFTKMLEELRCVLETTTSENSTGLTTANVLQLRFYYDATRTTTNASAVATPSSPPAELVYVDDGTHIRSAFYATVASYYNSCKAKQGLEQRQQMPAITVVPVSRIDVLLPPSLQTKKHQNYSKRFAMQAMVFDPVHTETELWIHHGRPNE